MNDRRAPLLNAFDKIRLKPCVVGDCVADRLAADARVEEIRKERTRMISPDSQLRYVTPVEAGLQSQLGLCAVFIQSRHGKPAVRGHVLRVLHRDKAIGIARISHNDHANIRSCISGDRFALRGKDLSIAAQEILALHSRLAGHASHEQCPIRAAKTLVEIHRGNDFSQKGKRTVLEFHHNAFQRRERDRNFNEMEIDRLIRPDPAAMRGRSE